MKPWTFLSSMGEKYVSSGGGEISLKMMMNVSAFMHTL
jgi:hypothetical protein